MAYEYNSFMIEDQENLEVTDLWISHSVDQQKLCLKTIPEETDEVHDEKIFP